MIHQEVGLHRKYKLLDYIFYMNMLLLSIEYINLNEDISVFRLGIFPLSIVGVYFISQIPWKKDIIFYSIISLSLIGNIISSLSYQTNYYLGIINSFGIFIFILFTLSYIRINGFSRQMLFVLSLYSLPHLFMFIFWYNDLELITFTNSSARFKGLHQDPNFMTIYISIALISKLYLLKYNTRKWKVVLYFSIVLDSLLVIYSQSKGGILALLFAFVLYLVLNKKILSIVILLPLLILMLIIFRELYQTMMYSSDFNIYEAIIWRFFDGYNMVQSESDARYMHAQQFMNLLLENKTTFIGYTRERYLHSFWQYPHNLLIDIVLEQGFVIGMLLILYVVYLIKKGFVLSLYCYRSRILLHISLVVFLSSLFLSSYTSKLFWLMLIMIYMSTKKNEVYGQ